MVRYSLGLDSSTQSLSAVVLDIDSGEIVFEKSLDYLKDRRLKRFGINSDYIIPPRVDGEADQPPQMHFASLDAMFSSMKRELGRKFMGDIVVVNNSGQQHGFSCFNSDAESGFNSLFDEESSKKNLVEILGGCLSYETTPIWKTSCTKNEAGEMRDRVGGKQRMIELSGSNSPLRFSGAKIRWIGKHFPDEYRKTRKIHLIGNEIPAILTGDLNIGCDYSNACGMSLMDYNGRKWSPELLDAVSKGLPGEESRLRNKLPALVAPDSIVGNVSRYFVRKYGFNKNCEVVAGSGDNPQSKVLVNGDLLSLGTSFVFMVDGDKLDMNGNANAMYDGVGRPFNFGCRTNGGMTWDKVKGLHGISKENYEPVREALRNALVGSERMLFWQPDNESFPRSERFDIHRVNYGMLNLVDDYNGIVESSLAAVYIHSKGFSKETSEPLYVTGGPTESYEVMRRVAAIWNRPVIPISAGGAALGAAVAGASSYLRKNNTPVSVEDLNRNVMKMGEVIEPDLGDVSAYHLEGSGYLDRFEKEEKKLLR
ncbi:xylulose kinase [Candidatus Pacearchaeota archaeon]|nr:xylulose kinase [Candidatus Pacearchaeota archaeon]